MAHQSEYDFLFKVGAASRQPVGPPATTRHQNCSSRPPPALTSPHTCSHTQLLLIGDSGVGKSCLLLRFAVSCRRSPPVRTLAPAARPATLALPAARLLPACHMCAG